jgi:hypothetical protein
VDTPKLSRVFDFAFSGRLQEKTHCCPILLNDLKCLTPSSRLETLAVSVNSGELKKALQLEGFQVYRTLDAEVRLAERVRENLILDSGVSVTSSEKPAVRVVFRAEKHLFMGLDDTELFARASALAADAVQSGFVKVGQKSVAMTDPNEEAIVLDTVFEVSFEKQVETVAEAADVCRMLLKLPRSVQSSG